MTQLEQINDIRKCAYLIIGALGTTAGKIKNLERKYYSFGELDSIHSALLAAVIKFRGGVFSQGRNADSAIADRFDRCMLEVSGAVIVEQSQLEQIDSLIADAKSVNEMLKQLTLNIEQLKAEHPQTQDTDALYCAAIDAAKEYRRSMAPLRAIRKDATLANGITATDGIEGLRKIAERFDRVMTDRYNKAMVREAAKAEKKAAKDAKYEK